MARVKKIVFERFTLILSLVLILLLLVVSFATKPRKVLALTATGGTVTQVGEDFIHTFTSSGTFTLNQAGSVDYLIVAGGGGGGASTGGPTSGGGGGAGGFITGSTSLSSGAYTIVVGNGGNAGIAASTNPTNGQDSSALGITATGGGAGGQGAGNAPASGGSGGGGVSAGNQAGASGSSGQGNFGGAGDSVNSRGGSGGGAGAVGTTTQGGNGLSSSISGSAVTYAGGGGAGWSNAIGIPVPGGTGGGGNGGVGNGPGPTGSNGTANTGGGGGGAARFGSFNSNGGNGGSGVVVIRYHSPAAPTIGTPTSLSSTSVRWNFTDNSAIEDGFKLYDESNNLKVTCAGSNLTHCDETGLTANTTYTRKVAAYGNSTGNGQYSNTVSFTTASITPLVPTVDTGTINGMNINLNPGVGAPATDVYAIYKKVGGSCDGTGGSYIAANGSDNGATPVWQTDSAWGTVTATGLSLDANVYSICVVDKNTAGTLTVFGPADSSNGGYCALSGCSLINGGPPMTKYTDGTNGARYVYGVDNGTGTNPNTAQLNISSGTTTVLATDTLVAGSITLTGGSLITNNGAQIKIGSKLWVVDADSDGVPATIALYQGPNAPTNGRRRTAIATMAVTPDCNDAISGQNNTLSATYYPDADLDTYTTSSASVGTSVCSSSSSWSASVSNSAPGSGSLTSSFSAGTRKDGQNGTDCNDSGTDANLVWYSHAQCYADADSDTYTNGVQANSTCIGASSIATPTCAQATARSLSGNGNAVTSITAATMRDSASATADCYDSNANAHPGSAYCGTVNRGDGSYDYDCVSGATFCGTLYDHAGPGTDTHCHACTTMGACKSNDPAYAQSSAVCGAGGYNCTAYEGNCDNAGRVDCSTANLGTQGCQ